MLPSRKLTIVHVVLKLWCKLTWNSSSEMQWCLRQWNSYLHQRIRLPNILKSHRTTNIPRIEKIQDTYRITQYGPQEKGTKNKRQTYCQKQNWKQGQLQKVAMDIISCVGHFNWEHFLYGWLTWSNFGDKWNAFLSQPHFPDIGFSNVDSFCYCG